MAHAVVVAGLCVVPAVGACEARSSEIHTVEIAEVEAALSTYLCARMFSCQCADGMRYQDIEVCEFAAKVLGDKLEVLPREYPKDDLFYDAGCMGALVDRFAQVGCHFEYPPLWDEDGQPQCRPPCHFYYGTRLEGQSCSIREPYISDCAQGLECMADTCVDPCNAQLAAPAQGELCPMAICAEGLFCEAVDLSDPMSERRCFAPRAVGEPCRGHPQCSSGYCPNGFCAQGQALGQSCETDQCGTGLMCVGDLCEPADAVICNAEVPIL